MAEIAVGLDKQLEVPVPAKAKAATERLAIIDLFRGTAHVIMTFDHVGYFSQANVTAETYNGFMVPGTVGSWYNVGLGLITNFVTIIFFMVTGVSVSLFERSRRKRGWSEWQITRFLLIRALILFVIDMTIGTLYWEPYQSFEVFSAVACCLVLLAFVRHLPLRVIAVLAVVSLLGYSLLIPQSISNPDAHFTLIESVLFHYQTEAAPRVGFTLIARIPVVLIGYVFGRLLQEKKFVISRNVLWISLGFFASWFVIHLIGGYGNLIPYQQGWPWYYFFIENKEPSSLAYTLLNFGGTFLVLYILHLNEERLKNGLYGRVARLFGQTSLFFYVIHLLMFSLVLSKIITPESFPVVALLRGAVMATLCLLIMIPLCVMYRRLRRRNPNSIWNYL